MAPLTPLDSYLACPRCGTSWQFIDLGSGLNYRCSGCEWFLTLATAAVPAAPAVPATTVNAVNTSTTIIAVTISANGATISAVNVNSVQVGTTAGTYLVPAAGTINIAYTVATPTWTWQLPTISSAVSAGGLALPVASGGAYFTAGMQLLVDTGANLEAVMVTAGATGTSIPLQAGPPGSSLGGLARAHNSGTSFGQAKLTASSSSVQAVPNASGWPAAMPSTF